MTRIAAAEIEEIQRLRREELSFREIAAKTGHSTSTVYKYSGDVSPVERSVRQHISTTSVTPRLNLTRRLKSDLTAIASEEEVDLADVVAKFVQMYRVLKKAGRGISDVQSYLLAQEAMSKSGISPEDVRTYLHFRMELGKRGLDAHDIDELAQVIQNYERIGVDPERVRKLADLDQKMQAMGLSLEDAVRSLQFSEKLSEIGFSLDEAQLIVEEIRRFEKKGLRRKEGIRQLCELLVKYGGLETSILRKREELASIRAELRGLEEENERLGTKRDQLTLECEKTNRLLDEAQRVFQEADERRKNISEQVRAGEDAIRLTSAWFTCLTDPHRASIWELDALREEIVKAEAIRKGEAPHLAIFKESIDDCIQQRMTEIYADLVKGEVVPKREHEAFVRNAQRTQQELQSRNEKLTVEQRNSQSQIQLMKEELQQTSSRYAALEDELRDNQTEKALLEGKVREKSQRIEWLCQRQLELESWYQLNQHPEGLTAEQINSLVPVLTKAKERKESLKEAGKFIRQILGVEAIPES